MADHEKKRFWMSCRILGLPEDEDAWTETDIRRQYRRLALIYHPDKNRSIEAPAKFREIQEAYEYLMRYQGFMEGGEADDDDDLGPENNHPWTDYDNSYTTRTHYEHTLFAFLRPILQSELFRDIGSRIFYTIIKHISAKCEEKAILLLQRLDKRTFSKIRELLVAYREIFHFSEDFLDKVDQAYRSTVQGDECIILSPFLDDLFENNLYRLTKDDQTYLIPLWHHELVYDHGGADLDVQCVPILPEGITLDEKNNLHVRVDFSIEEIWSKAEHVVHLGESGRRVVLLRDQLRITKQQTVVFNGQGISRINVSSVYDVSKKSDVYIHVTVQ